jgi:hypothetical protein
VDLSAKRRARQWIRLQGPRLVGMSVLRNTLSG